MATLLFKSKLVVLALVSSCFSFAQVQRNWNGKKCAVVLTYDDALNIHLDKVIPMLNSYNFRGTFYLIGGSPNVANRIEDWRKAAKKGHELGNHTLNHPCDASLPGMEWVQPENDLSKYTVARAVNEIKITNTLLKAIDGKTERTFAYPCGNMTIGDSYFYELVKDEFVGARGGEPAYPSVKEVNLDDIAGFVEINSTAEQMIAKVKEAEKKGSFVVFIFHGVGGEHALNIALDEHKKLLDYLKKREKDIWVAPMVDVAGYIRKKQTVD